MASFEISNPFNFRIALIAAAKHQSCVLSRDGSKTPSSDSEIKGAFSAKEDRAARLIDSKSAKKNEIGLGLFIIIYRRSLDQSGSKSFNRTQELEQHWVLSPAAPDVLILSFSSWPA